MDIKDNIWSFGIPTPQSTARAMADRVRQRRLELNLTQEGLAARSGVPFATYRRFERTGQASLDAVLRVANALGDLHDFDGLFTRTKFTTIEEVAADAVKERKRGKRNE